MSNQAQNEQIEYEDPIPPEDGMIAAESEEYKSRLLQYSKDLRKALEESSVYGEQAWHDISTIFWPLAFEVLGNVELLKWRDLLQKNGIKVRSGRGVSKKNALRTVALAQE
jgi:hypothetical protein